MASAKKTTVTRKPRAKKPPLGQNTIILCASNCGKLEQLEYLATCYSDDEVQTKMMKHIKDYGDYDYYQTYYVFKLYEKYDKPENPQPYEKVI
jgi:hypothetical protein